MTPREATEQLEIFAALKRLVELKMLKGEQGKTEYYENEKILAWGHAKRLVKKYELQSKGWGVTA